MALDKEPYNAAEASDWLVCLTCGTQFPSSSRSVVKTCHICDDPRQFVPRSGQTFTTLAALREKHRNEFIPYEPDRRLLFIRSVPQVAIGQRAILVRTPRGNVLWDCVALLDEETALRIEDEGGLRAIVISHPHYYTTHVQWARRFGCPVYIAAEDAEWATIRSSHQVLVRDIETAVEDTGVRIIKLGGHFPGSLVLLFEQRLLIADTVVTTPAGMGRWEIDGNGDARTKPPGLNTYTFQWSIPNMIPLGVEEMARMWGILSKYEFAATHGAFLGMDVGDGDDEDDKRVKKRMLDSMQIQTRIMGMEKHPFMSVTM